MDGCGHFGNFRFSLEYGFYCLVSLWGELTYIILGGFMESLDKAWILQGHAQQCEQFEKTPNTLGLKNMAGVFILVAAGIVGGIGLIIIEVVYKKHQIKKQKRMEIARHAADKWRGTIEVRKIFSGRNLHMLRRMKEFLLSYNILGL